MKHIYCAECVQQLANNSVLVFHEKKLSELSVGSQSSTKLDRWPKRSGRPNVLRR